MDKRKFSDGEKVKYQGRLLEGIVIPPTQKKAVSEAKKGKKRKKKNHGSKIKEV